MFLLVGHEPSQSCAIDSAMSNMAGSLCLCCDLAFVLAPGAAQHPVESEVIWGLRWGLPQVEFLTPQALRSRRGCHWIGLGPLQSGVLHSFPLVLPLMTRCRSLHRRASSVSPGMTTRLRCPFQVWVALSERDPEMTAMLPGPPRTSGSCGILYRVPTLRGWTSGFSVGVVLVLRRCRELCPAVFGST